MDDNKDEVQPVAGDRRYVFQVINYTREEMVFGVGSEVVDKEFERLAKMKDGPLAGWAKGDAVLWRPLTDAIEAGYAKSFKEGLEKRVPPNKYRVLPNP